MTDIPNPAPSTPRSPRAAKPKAAPTRSISVLLPVDLADRIDLIASSRMIGRGLLVAKLIELGIAQLPDAV